MLPGNGVTACRCQPRSSTHDTDSAGDIAQELGVSQMPVFTIFHDGDLEDTVRGAKAKALEEAVGKVYKGKVVEE